MRRLRRRGLNVARRQRSRAGERVGQVREVENGGGAFDAESGDVVRSRRHFRRGECAQPYPRFLPGLADFGHPFSPVPHAHPSVHGVLVRLAVAFLRLEFG